MYNLFLSVNGLFTCGLLPLDLLSLVWEEDRLEVDPYLEESFFRGLVDSFTDS